MANTNTKRKQHGSGGRTAAIVIAFILVFVLLAGLLAYVLGGFDRLLNDTYYFRAKDVTVTGATVKDEEQGAYIEGLGSGGTVTFSLNATADTEAQLSVSVRAKPEDKRLDELLGVAVNGVPYTAGNAVVKGDASEEPAWRESVLGAVSLNEGKNTVTVTGTETGVDLEWTALSVPHSVKLTALGQEAEENGGMKVTEPAKEAGDEAEARLSVVSQPIARTNFASYGIAPIAETAVTLTATLEPEYATDKRVDWSIAWKNAASEWATGKTVTDYVTVTPTEDGALTANVACLKAFAEQIVITVSARDEESDAQATCNVDYVQKYLGTGTMVMTSGTKFNVSTPAMPSSPDALIVKTELPKDLTPYVISQHDYVICKSGTYTIPLSGQVTLKYEMQTNISGIAVSYANNTLGYDLSVKSGKQLFNTLQTTFTTTGTGKSESVEQQRIEIPFAGPSFNVAQYLTTIFPEIGGSGSFSDQYPGYVYLFNQTYPHGGTAGEYEFSITVSAEFGGEVKSITTNVQVEAISMTVTGVQLDKDSIKF